MPKDLEPGQCRPIEPPGAAYERGERVWIRRGGAQCPGIVECASALAATVMYRHTSTAATVHDTVAPSALTPRIEHDDLLDSRELV